MLVQFIAEPTIGAKERRLIRSHVMKGKNAGKPRPPRTRLIHRNAKPTNTTNDDSSDIEELIKADFDHTLSLNRLLWNELSLTSYPYHMSPAAEKWVYQRLWVIAKALYPPEFCAEVNLSQYAWFQYVLEDQAYFHCLLAIASSFTNHFGGPRSVSSSALKHISQAYRMTNERLSGAEACSDKAIAVVTMLAIYQRMHHQQSIGLVHLHGLRRMIELRGGLARLMIENRALAQKPWRLALEFALQDGSLVTFDILDIPQPAFDTSRPLISSPTTTNSLIDLDLLTQLNSITDFIRLLSTNHTKLNHLDYSDSVCICLHRLLDYAPLSTQHRPSLDPLDDLVHLTLVTVMTTLMPEYGQNQARYGLLSSQLQMALRKYAATQDPDSEVLLWALFVGYATILQYNDETWLVSLAGEMCASLHLDTWMQARSMLCKNAWIGVFYDKVGLKLWFEINRQKRKVSG